MNENYSLIDTRELPHINAAGYLYRHAGGAAVMHLKSADDNKVFCAAFKTPPANETGIAHIMEHCVLGGSRKYPLKDPFNELSAGSLYTFLNAMTYPDRTIYPIASVNDKDFLNLMDVYLDAVFFPKIYDRKETLMQEGWHYQLESEKAPLKYNGIVYNEMKGAYSDPQDAVQNALRRALYPNSLYKLDAGGNPDHIPELDYEQLINFHKKYYHPQNAMIIFYGNMDIGHCLDVLHTGYLSKFQPLASGRGADVEIAAAAPLAAPVFVQDAYSVANEADLAENYMAVGINFPDDMSLRDITGLKLLNYILMATPASPLYKALVEAEAGQDISGYVSGEILHPYMQITLKNAAMTAQELKTLVDGILTSIAQNGLSKKFVAACLNFLEFQTKEEDFGNQPKGLIYTTRALTTWTYGKSPFDGLMGIIHLEEIRALCEKGGYLEGLITKYLLDNPSRAYVTLNPVLDLDGQKEADVAKKLAEIKAAMSEEEIAQTIAEYQGLRAFQEAQDSEEIRSLIPRLAVSDVKREIEKVPLNVRREGDAQVLLAPLTTNDIMYVSMMFDIGNLPKNYLPAVKILQYILSKIGTKNYSTSGITEEIKANLGGLSFTTDIISKSLEEFYPRAAVFAKFLSANTAKMFEIVTEIAQHTRFDDKSQIKNYILEIKASMEQMFLTNGSVFAVERAAGYFSAAAAYNDAVGGLSFYEYVRDLLDNFDVRFDSFQSDLNELCRMIYSKENVKYSIVAEDELYNRYNNHLRDFHNGLFDAYPREKPAGIPLITPKNDGFITASKVQYCAMAANIAADGHAYTGALKVLSNIIDDYLYDEIRVKGGAYGMGSNFGRNGGMFLYSYRDPHVANTYEVFKGAAEHVKSLDLSRAEMEKFILGTIRSFDRPATNAHKGFVAAVNHILGITDEARQKERDEILSADLATIHGLANVLEAALAQDNFCAVGSEAAIVQNQQLFGNIRKV
ncbi:MAG: insulinase family protein [Clostridiales bacterium]|jgi:Zn-dependent M16 (insulinase) family peptidase|nr:insulinase family protein [Clostridiales bacterium]